MRTLIIKLCTLQLYLCIKYINCCLQIQMTHRVQLLRRMHFPVIEPCRTQPSSHTHPRLHFTGLHFLLMRLSTQIFGQDGTQDTFTSLCKHTIHKYTCISHSACRQSAYLPSRNMCRWAAATAQSNKTKLTCQTSRLPAASLIIEWLRALPVGLPICVNKSSYSCSENTLKTITTKTNVLKKHIFREAKWHLALC